MPLAEALVAGGLPAIEITLRTPAGSDALRAAAAGVPGALVGAGTVRSAEAADAAIDAGARFVVSPGLVDAVVEACRRRGVLALPGVATPTELLRALDLGCTTVKLFPAAVLGGPAMIRSLTALGTGAAFVPTGGITLDSAPSYLGAPRGRRGRWQLDGAARADRARGLGRRASARERAAPGSAERRSNGRGGRIGPVPLRWPRERTGPPAP